MVKSRLFAIAAVISMFGCSQDSTTRPIASQQTETTILRQSMAVQIPLNSSIKREEIASATITIFDGDSILVESALTITETGISGTVDNIPVGNNRIFKLTVLNSSGDVSYSGTTVANIIKDETVKVTIILEPIKNTGSAEIIGIISKELSLPKPVAHWGFNTPTDTAFDKSGNHHHGIIENATVVDGIDGKALYFQYDKRSSVIVAQNRQLEESPERTISMWVKADSTQQSANPVLIRKCEHQGNGYGLYWMKENERITYSLDYHITKLTNPAPSNISVFQHLFFYLRKSIG